MMSKTIKIHSARYFILVIFNVLTVGTNYKNVPQWKQYIPIQWDPPRTKTNMPICDTPSGITAVRCQHVGTICNDICHVLIYCRLVDHIAEGTRKKLYLHNLPEIINLILLHMLLPLCIRGWFPLHYNNLGQQNVHMINYNTGSLLKPCICN